MRRSTCGSPRKLRLLSLLVSVVISLFAIVSVSAAASFFVLLSTVSTSSSFVAIVVMEEVRTNFPSTNLT